MPLRILGWSLLFSMLAGNAIAAQVDDNVSLSQLRAENKAVIFFYTGMYEKNRCESHMLLAKRDASGRFLAGELISLKGWYDNPRDPSRVVVPAGEYGIVSFSCSRINFNSRIAQMGDLISRMIGRAPPTVYEKPFAMLKTNPGEVVDVGTIDFFKGSPGQFTVYTEPMTQPVSQRLAEISPGLFKRRVIRTMIAVGKR
jgi:hypothetical protein